MTRTVLITGAGGNIGTKLRAHFSALGWTLRLLDVDDRGDTAIAAADLADDAIGADMSSGLKLTVCHLVGSENPAIYIMDPRPITWSG